MNLIFLILASVFLIPYPFELAKKDQALVCEYWVAPPPEGNNDNPGTFVQPWATLEYAATKVPDNGCTVWLKDGEYLGENKLRERYTIPTTFKAQNPYKAVMINDGMVINISGGQNMVFDGFEFRHSGPGASALVVKADRAGDQWAEYITFRNNIFHDSYNNDLLKVHNGSRFITIEGNVFYNQQGPDQHIDVNSVTDVTIQDNIFFNDFAGSGRTNERNTKHFIVIKDSNGESDGLLGGKRVTVRRNIFLNWEGGKGETLIQVGNDGEPYYEADTVRIENNLFIGNSSNLTGAVLGVSGVRNVWFVNNTVAGDLPSGAYAFRVDQKGSNPQNQNIYFYNNIWSDPTGTMGADLSKEGNIFSRGEPSEVSNLILDNNLYGNGPKLVPPGEVASPLQDDARRVVANPLLNTHQEEIVLPRWNGSAFLSGNLSIRQEFVRLVELYGKIPVYSPAIGRADPALMPPDDILSHPRSASPDLGAYEVVQPPIDPRISVLFTIFHSLANTLKRLQHYLTGD